MPSFDQHSESEPIKLLLIGDPGSSKSGSLASLANAGYRLVIADFDNGLSIMRQYLTGEGSKRVFYETFTDQIQQVGGVTRPLGEPQAFSSCMKLLDSWKFPERKFKLPGGKEVLYPAYSLGALSDWGEDTIFVIDSFTYMSYASMFYCIYMNDKDNSDRWLDWYPQDYKHCQRRLESVLEKLKSRQTRCHVIITAHLRYMGGGGVQVTHSKVDNTETRRVMDSREEGKGYPFTFGRNLPPMMGSYFNAVLMCERKMMMANLITNTQDMQIDLKNPRPDVVPNSIPISKGELHSGLARYFELLRGQAPKV